MSGDEDEGVFLLVDVDVGWGETALVVYMVHVVQQLRWGHARNMEWEFGAINLHVKALSLSGY